jgi:hypothetical protein
MGEPARILEIAPPARRVMVLAWPRLMDVTLAAAYLSRSETVIRERGPKPKRDGRSVLYDIRDLDRWADSLDAEEAGQDGHGRPPPADNDPAAAAAAEEERFFARRRRRGAD